MASELPLRLRAAHGGMTRQKKQRRLGPRILALALALALAHGHLRGSLGGTRGP